MGGKIRVGLVGCGHIAERHLAAYAGLPYAEVAAACDPVPGRARELLDRYGFAEAKSYSGFEEMFAAQTFDAVSVCVHNALHAPASIAALENGACVLLEKPFASSVADAVEIMRAEKRTGKFVSVGFQQRYSGSMKQVKEICQSGRLGKIYYIQTGGGRRRGLPTSEGFVKKECAGSGALGDIGCYSLDTVLDALGYPRPTTVTGYTSDFFGKKKEYEFSSAFNVEDFAAAFIRLETGCVIDFRIAWAMHPDTSGDTLIYGTEGALRIPSTECWNSGAERDMTLYSDVDGSMTETVVPLAEKVDRDECLARKVEDFARAVRDGGRAPVPTSEALINQVIIDGVLESAKLGREISVEIPEV